MSKVQKIFQEEKESQNMCTSFLWFLFKDVNISNTFYKIQNFYEWQLVLVITHWIYTFLNPWDLQKYINQRGEGWVYLLLLVQVNLSKKGKLNPIVCPAGVVVFNMRAQKEG